MPCSNCYNGCPDIVSDKCVKYTGLDVPILGIKNGDSLLYVETALADYLASVINGVGVKPIIDPLIICNVVKKYLTECEELNLNDLLTAIIKAVCDLQEQVDAIVAELAVLNAPYDPDCVIGISDVSNTHNVLQNLIHNFCELKATVLSLQTDLDTNYVKLVDLDDLIQDYLDTQDVSSKYYTKMVPFTVVEYYGPLNNYPTPSDGFGGTGIGFGAWEKVYLCNGLNGTPDKRGRVGVGVTNGMGGGAFSPAVDPALPGNPTYTLGSTAGSNAVTLISSQLPAHTHPASVTISDPGHKHDIWGITGGDNDDMSNTVRFAGGDKIQGETSFYFTNTEACQSAPTGLNGSNVTVTVNNNTGGGASHANNQPALACYYIMYIP